MTARAPSRAAILLWMCGWPFRQVVLLPVRAYRVSVGRLVGGGCRFYPSCSAYAEAAIEQTGVIRGVAFTAWRLLRCSPLSAGGIDHAPEGRTWRAIHETRQPAGAPEAHGHPSPRPGTEVAA